MSDYADGDIIIEPKINEKSFDAQIEELEDKLEQLKADLDMAEDWELPEEDIKSLRTEIEKTTNKIISLKEAKEKLEKSPSKMNLFENLIQGAKRLTFGILGIRTAYTIIRRASSSYLATDTHTTQQLEANWTALGVFMETIIKAISTLMKKLVTSILYFASVLTGVNYLEKANTAILNKQKKATEGLTKANKKLKTSFDELETLDDTSSSASVGTSIDTSVLFDVSDIGQNAKTTIESLALSLKPVYDLIKQIIDICVKHPDILTLTIGGIALLKTLTKIIGVAGAGAVAGTGLAGVASLLAYIAGFGVIAIEIAILYKTVKEARDETQKLVDTYDLWKKTMVETQETYQKILDQNKDTPEFIDNITNSIKDNVDKLQKDTKAILDNRKEKSFWQMIVDMATGTWEAENQKIIANYEAMKENVETLKKAYDQGKLNEEQKQIYIDTLKEYRDWLEETNDETNVHINFLKKDKDAYAESRQELEKAKEELKKFGIQEENTTKDTEKATDEVKNFNKAVDNIKDKATVKVDADTTGAKNSINTLFGKLQSRLLTSLGITFPTIKLARGGIVNNPGRGVSLGSNILAGEAGPEAVLPLNEETMGAIAQLIADKMVINLTNINQINGRIFSREIKRVQNEEDFAFNR